MNLLTRTFSYIFSIIFLRALIEDQTLFYKKENKLINNKLSKPKEICVGMKKSDIPD